MVEHRSHENEKTKHARAGETPRQSEAWYRIVADNTCDWEPWLDPRGGLLYCSPSRERITGYAAEEFERHGDPGAGGGAVPETGSLPVGPLL